MTASIALTVAFRYLLVALFLPFSALDKTLNFKGAVAQAREVVPIEPLARLLILGALLIEIVLPLAILTGYGDRLAALIMAAYCGVTALLWKRFWVPGDFWRSGASRARELFWDFLKNFAVAAGFLFIAFGMTARAIHPMLDRPVLSTHPYATPAAGGSRHG
ncbi:MAG: DoxX family membrane protein [Steroidobacteraceae bacterium]